MTACLPLRPERITNYQACGDGQFVLSLQTHAASCFGWTTKAADWMLQSCPDKVNTAGKGTTSLLKYSGSLEWILAEAKLDTLSKRLSTATLLGYTSSLAVGVSNFQ